MSELFLGMDGGQSGTTTVIGNSEGQIIGWATAGPCNHVGAAEGRAKFLRVMRECLTQAASRAGLTEARPHYRAACLGMSGGPDDKAALLRELIDADHLVITHDAKIALAGATGGQPGIVVIAGTGSIAYGENATGESARAGGWGYLFGDEGGAFHIARQALRAAMREYEGWGPRTAVTPAIVEFAEAQNPNDALHAFYTEAWPRHRVATFAATVDRLAEEGDPIALRTLTEAAQNLASLAKSVRSRLFQEDEAVNVAVIGGVFSSERIRAAFHVLIPAQTPAHAPATGALLLAYRAAGLVPPMLIS